MQIKMVPTVDGVEQTEKACEVTLDEQSGGEVSVNVYADGELVDVEETTAYLIPGRVYTALKWAAALGLPALAALLTGLGQVWGISELEQVSQTVALVGVFAGAVIGVSAAKNYLSSGKSQG